MVQGVNNVLFTIRHHEPTEAFAKVGVVIQGAILYVAWIATPAAANAMAGSQ